MFVPEIGFTVTEHDPNRPWVVIGSEHRTVQLDDRREFFAWAREQWPGEYYTITPDPWQLSPE